MLAQQVVQEIAAGRGLGGQVLIIQLTEMAARLVQAGAVKGGGGVGIKIRAGDQAQPAKQPLRWSWSEASRTALNAGAHAVKACAHRSGLAVTVRDRPDTRQLQTTSH